MSYQSSSSSVINPQVQAKRTTDNLTLSDQDAALLDDIEAATSRIYNQSRGLNEESKTHEVLLNKAENDMTLASLALRAETSHAEKIRRARSGVCWMYGVIIAESVTLVLLVYIGLSNS